MITVVPPYSDILLARNPVIYSVSSNNAFSTNGVAASLLINVYAISTVEDTAFTLGFNGKSLTFELVADPDDSGLQLPVAEVGETFNAWGARLFDALCLNYDLRTYYNMRIYEESPAFSIQLKSKYTGTRFNILPTDTLDSSFNFYPSDGTDPVVRENFGIVGTIWRHDYSTFADVENIKIGEDILPVDLSGVLAYEQVQPSGIAVFNFSEYILSEIYREPVTGERLKYFFTWPQVPGEFTREFTEHILDITVSFAETISGVVQALHFQTVKRALAGGLNAEMLSQYTALGQGYFDLSENIIKFLTWAPTTKISGTSVPEKLFFLIFGERYPYHYRLAVKVYYTDLTNTQYYADIDYQAQDTCLIECMVGHDHLGIGNLNPEKSVDYWEVWLDDSGEGGETVNDITERRRFILDKIDREYERIFMFRNSFSAYDVVRFVGKSEVGLEYERLTGKEISSLTNYLPVRKSFENSETEHLVVNSGFISREMKDYLREMYLSTEVYEIIGERLLPVVNITAKSASFFKDGITLYDFQIEYDRASTNNLYSKYIEIIDQSSASESESS